MFQAPVVKRLEGEIKSLGGKCSHVLELCLAAITRDAVSITQGAKGPPRNLRLAEALVAETRAVPGQTLVVVTAANDLHASSFSSCIRSHFVFSHYFFSLKLSMCLRGRLKDGKTKRSQSLGTYVPQPEPCVCGRLDFHVSRELRR